MKSEVYKTKVDTRDKVLARISDAAACVKKREDQLRQTTRDLHTRAAKCTEVDGVIFESLLSTTKIVFFRVTNLSFKHKINIEVKLTLSSFSLSLISSLSSSSSSSPSLYIGLHILYTSVQFLKLCILTMFMYS
jgi:hypothetical protein